ncbi:MAG: phospholipase D-like domain-containing protein [Gemmatimonadales bacterium]
MIESLADLWPAFLSLAHLILAIGVTVDAVLRPRHVAAVLAWVGIAWLAPIIGPMLYLGFGVNRLQRAAVSLDLETAWNQTGVRESATEGAIAEEEVADHFPALVGMAQLGQRVTGRPLLAGNRIEPLVDGDQAYPQMLTAIQGARESLTLLTYIFDHDRAGREFYDALVAAHRRGVAVRVLIDAVGARYGRPSMVTALRRAGVPVAEFLPVRLTRLYRYLNMRNHRKILVADGRAGFMGGMNIRDGHWLERRPAHPVQCLHFRVEGPVVADLQRTFAVDWAFATRETLLGDTWFPELEPAGPVLARGVPDGPDADIDNLPEVLLGALQVARSRVGIVTPYFLPDETLLRALQATAMRGVRVDIIIPARSNIRVMDWAVMPQFLPLLSKGCHVHFSPAPFDHSKLLVVDGGWSLLGSTNWDARSLRLNFEYNIECYDTELALALEGLVDERIRGGRRLTIDALRRRPLPLRLRDGLARLGTPYL